MRTADSAYHFVVRDTANLFPNTKSDSNPLTVQLCDESPPPLLFGRNGCTSELWAPKRAAYASSSHFFDRDGASPTRLCP